ncbi:NDMA-dependent alcohol dehydrogenase [Rhodococcus sp. D2-41]|uniref:alcohol dehydrogenase n=1 Tax=Speluncibacter jeojiensis TaxID=2710754 RepID=A0A9X4M1M5_9ACTN|nr:NDMA-dependent alcohol dehydrogenase [Rhodococcus sp. D2-41]MDG3012558.1 NDMA-dependent alcohol dehydrogenase [Rhodococcus sp. D2-41]MDG3015325.1 NDMA-dependent alcohol dehydrogenase [Corynebacteriales bacterium D3-21]
MKTKGAILWGVNEPWSVEEIELGDPRDGEVQIELAASGLCHSDYHLVTGDIAIPSFPALGGHEGAGVITKVGPGVKDLKEGDHVVLSFIPACGHCEPCSTGHQNLCDLGMYLLTGQSISDGTNRVTARGKGVIPMSLLGTFSPYVTVHQYSVVKIDEYVPLEVAALVGCGVTTGWGSATNIAQVKAGETVVVVGIGGIGINSVQAAAVSGAKYVIAIDPVEYHRDQAKKFGATHTFSSMAEAIAPVMELTWGKMAEKVLLTMGVVRGEDIDPAMTLTGKGGRCVVVGLASMADMDTKMNLFLLSMLQKELCGSIFGGANPRKEIPSLLSMYRAGKLNLDDLITNTYKLEDINQGYQDMLDGKNVRGIIKYTSADRN